MKTAETILLEWGCEQDYHNIDKETAIIVMKEYAKVVIDEILQDTSMIYDDGFGEAVYDYQKFNEFKEKL